jgi:hypothetical protein
MLCIALCELGELCVESQDRKSVFIRVIRGELCVKKLKPEESVASLTGAKF